MSNYDPVARTAICDAGRDHINVRGHELSADLIGNQDFVSYFLFLLTGEWPGEDLKYMLNATLVAIAEHGLVPSNQVARMTVASAPESYQGAVAAGLLGCGSVVFGSSHECGTMLNRLAAPKEGSQSDAHTEFSDRAKAEIQRLKENRLAIPGFGHPQHKDGDPRAIRLLQLAKERGCAHRHVQMLETLRDVIPSVLGRPLPINVSGAIPAVMLDVGFPVAALKGIPLLARTGGLIAHLLEESQRPIGFKISRAASESVEYDGVPLGKND